MKIHVISTINGQINEGMRNIATHLSRELEKENTVTYSGLKDIFGIIKNGSKSDVTLVFARLLKPVYQMLRLIRPFVKNICVVCVQPISDEFAQLNKNKRVADYCFTLIKDDVKNAFDDDAVSILDVGIDSKKFKKNNQKSKRTLKSELGFPDDKVLVLHVGHCSAGRGLEDMLRLDKNKYHCAVIASGMFDDEAVISKLKSGGVDVRFGFVKNIEDYYNAADVYLFPTRSDEFVISVPLSVMESLACGTPVVAYRSFEKIAYIGSTDYDAIRLINSADELSSAVEACASADFDGTLLADTKSWETIGADISARLKKYFGVN